MPQVQVSLTRVQPEKPYIPECEDVNEEFLDHDHNSISSNIAEKIHEVESEQGGKTTIFYGEEAWFQLTLTNISNLQVDYPHSTGTDGKYYRIDFFVMNSTLPRKLFYLFSYL